MLLGKEGARSCGQKRRGVTKKKKGHVLSAQGGADTTTFEQEATGIASEEAESVTETGS